MKIFIVDDSRLDRKLLIRSLQKAGIGNEIIEASDGEEALSTLDAEHGSICLVFLDWQLPKIDGLEILEKLAQNPNTASLPVIMLTGRDSEESEAAARERNPKLVAFVVKPLDAQKVAEVATPYVK